MQWTDDQWSSPGRPPTDLDILWQLSQPRSADADTWNVHARLVVDNGDGEMHLALV